MKKIKFISMVLVLCLALMGAAFAQWTEDITINGTVETAVFDLQFTAASTNDDNEPADPGKALDVAKTEADVITVGKSIDVDVTNAYPGYTATVSYTITNNSTIPVRITPTLTDASGGTISSDLTVTPSVLPASLAAGASHTGTIDISVNSDVTADDQNYSIKYNIKSEQIQ